MTLKESYQSAYARKNKAITAQYNTKKATLTAKKKRLQKQGEEKLRAAYGEYMRAAAAAGQVERADGRWGGAAENQKAGLKTAHRAKQENNRADTAADVAAVEEQISTATADKDKKLSDNAIALQQKLDNLEIKEAEAAKKAAEKATKSAKSSSNKSKGSASSGKVTRSQAISLMKMGIYDASFAKILGISDDEVRSYIKNVGKKSSNNDSSSKNKTASDNRLPGTYKPPLK